MRKMLQKVLLVTGFCALCASADDPILVSMHFTDDEGFKLIEGQLTSTHQTIAVSNFTNSINQTGWGYFEVRTSSHFEDGDQVREN